jgi:hypothetical protein
VSLLRSQEAWVFGALADSGFDPREFDLVDTFSVARPGGTAPALIHRPTGFYFAFGRSAQHLQAEFSPGATALVATFTGSDWNGVFATSLLDWLRYLRREIEAPDLWGELGREAQLVAGDVSEEANTPFSAEEQVEIRRQLQEVKQLLRGNAALGPAQLEALDARIDYLAHAVSRLGRIDWREAFVGAMLGLVLQAVVPPEAVREVLLFVARTLGRLFGGGVPDLPSG